MTLIVGFCNKFTLPTIYNSGTGEFPAQMTSNAENVSIWRRHHAKVYTMRTLWHDSSVVNGIATSRFMLQKRLFLERANIVYSHFRIWTKFTVH